MSLRVSVLSLLLVVAAVVTAQTETEVLESAHLWGDTERAIMQVRLDIDTGRGAKSRSLEVFIDNRDEASKLFARVTLPAFLSQMKYLYIRSANGSESKWVATSRGTRQLSNAQRTEKLFDSDFTTEDLSKLAVEEYHLSFESTNRSDVTVIRAKPIRTGESTRIITIDRATMLIIRVEYRDAEEEIERVYQVEETKVIDGLLSVSVCSMSDRRTDTTTRLIVDSFDTKSDIPERVFSRASL